MTSKGLIKRFLPFFATFAAGLFIASFFVSVTAPFSGMGEHRLMIYKDWQRLQFENLQLQDRNAQLEEQIEQLRRHPDYLKQIEREDWNSPNRMDPLPPKPPRAPLNAK